MAGTKVDVSIDGAAARMTFSTDGGLNVLDSDLLGAIGDAAERIAGEERVRTLVVAAEGKVFMAGADIKELGGCNRQQAAAIGRKGCAAFDALAELPCVTVARLHGAALGGGLEVALACDFRVAVAGAKLGAPEGALGLVPGWRGMSRLQALCGLGAARRLVFSADAVSAEDACTMGLVDEVVGEAGMLDARIADLLKRFERSSPNAIAMAKRAFAGYDEVEAFADCFDHPDRREGIAAFVEKRAATWMTS